MTEGEILHQPFTALIQLRLVVTLQHIEITDLRTGSKHDPVTQQIQVRRWVHGQPVKISTEDQVTRKCGDQS